MKTNRKHDVSWHFPDKKRNYKNKPFAYSTKAISDNIKIISEYTNNKTPNEILAYIIENNLVGCYEEIDIMEQYIKNGYGNYSLNFY